MIRRIAAVFTTALVLLAAGVAGAETPADSATGKVVEAVRDGTLGLSFRYRFAFIDDDKVPKDAYVSTLKTRLSLAPKLNDDWSFLLQFDHVQHVGADSFNDTRNGKTDYPVEPDPGGADLNQVLIRYSGIANTDIVFGRQAINRDGQRFIGTVAWRQNEQTYDSVSIAYGREGPFKAFYSYTWRVNRVFGPEPGTPAAKLDSNSHFIDADYRFGQALKLAGYVYLIDLDDADSFSNATFGIHADGRIPATEDLNFRYVAEYAYQRDYGDNPVSYDADYYWLEGRVDWRQFGAAVGWEVLGGGDRSGTGFRTPLATLHKFQGWADRFVGVGATGSQAGVEDFYVGLTAKLFGGNFLLRFHDFNAQKGGAGLGTEWDAQAKWSFAEYYGLLLKFASYDADSFSDDTVRTWVQMTASF